MAESAHLLFNAPPPEPLESPSSWLTRLAISQAVPVAELAAYLELDLNADPDFAFNNRRKTRRIAKSCQLQAHHFWLMGHMFGGVKRIDKQDTFLLRQGPYPRYRYCPRCLLAQRTPHFPIQWRFRAWRWCEEHQTLLRDRCPNCHATVVLPANLVFSMERNKRPQIDCCVVCGEKLSNKARATRFSGTRQFLTPWERHLIDNGRAVLAAFLYRVVLVESAVHLVVGRPRQVRKPLRGLRELERAGHLPHGTFRYETLDAQRYHFRHPWTDRLIPVGRVREEKAPQVPVAGLFDG